MLIEANAQITRERALYRSHSERLEAAMMLNPIDSKKAYAYFGFMIASMPPITLAARAISLGDGSPGIELLFIVLLVLAGLIAGSVGYLSGKLIPPAMDAFRDFRPITRILSFSLIGLAWGSAAGITGGLILFIIGAVFAGIAGGIVGAALVPVFALCHGAMRRGDLIELKHFLPISVGITLSLCALILGL